MYAPRKVFIKENGEYLELTYEAYCTRCETDLSYQNRRFLPLHGMLMEVSEEEYVQFYRQKNRQKYLQRTSAANQEISFDMLTTGDMNGEDILTDPLVDIQEQVESDIMADKLHRCLSLLEQDEQTLIEALYFQGFSEHEWSRKTGIPQKTINDRKRRILGKLKNFWKPENNSAQPPHFLPWIVRGLFPLLGSLTIV